MSMKSSPVRLCSVSQLPPEGRVVEMEAGAQTLCVARLNGQIAALDNECPHHGGPLGQGEIDGGKVVCPWHAYAYDLVTGAAEGTGPAAKVYAVTVIGEQVMIDL